MNVIQSIDELRALISKTKMAQESVGLVPTMGYLHDGHLTLVRACQEQNDLTVVSLFVNPLQFNNETDLDLYPSDIDRDIRLLEQAQVDVLFVPNHDQIYKKKPNVKISFGEIGQRLEGEFRPGHFDGVGVIVSKLFHLVSPDRAYFGLKDLQQFALIRQMVYDLSFPVEIIPVPTAREPNGLAMSSRNARLSESGKAIASNLHKGLTIAAKSLQEGLPVAQTKQQLIQYYQNIEGLQVEYASVNDPTTFREIETYSPDDDVAICVAAYVEGVRLIDNLYLQPESQK